MTTIRDDRGRIAGGSIGRPEPLGGGGPVLDAPLGGTPLRRSGWLLVCLGILAMICLASLTIGSLPIAPDRVLSVLLHPDGSEISGIIWELRIPRTVLAVAAGAALGIAGALIQALTRNPLADPGILGVSAGASLAVVVAATAFGVTALTGQIVAALLGAVLSTTAVYLIGSSDPRRTASPATLVLAGVALGAVLLGIASAISLLTPRTLDLMRFWNAGTSTGRDLATIVAGLPLILTGLLAGLLSTGALNAIALGDDQARALGVRLAPVRVTVVAAVTLLCGTATALCGPIGFVGLMVPHVARWLFGVDQRWIFAFTLVLSPVLVVLSDIVARLVLWPGEVPVGLVLAVLGAPVLIMLVRRPQAARL